MLEAIGHAGLSDVIVVVTRYFGGILLGTGGLVRAYTASAAAALDAAQVVTVRACVRCRVTVEYGLYERAMLLISGAGAQAMAEVIKHYYPKLVDVHNYPPASSSNQKCYNWSTLNSKTLHLPYRQGAQKNRSVIKAARDNRCDHM